MNVKRLLGWMFFGLLCGIFAFAQEESPSFTAAEPVNAPESGSDLAIVQPEAAQPEAAPALPQEPPAVQAHLLQLMYHLLVLDRTYCAGNSDIEAPENAAVLYKFAHGRNGYIVVLLSSITEGPVFPEVPDKSRVVVQVSSSRKAALKEYIDSREFRRYVTSRTVLSQLKKSFEDAHIIAAMDRLPVGGVVSAAAGRPAAVTGGKTYRLQVGAFAEAETADRAVQRVKSAGFDVAEEEYGLLRRVLAVNIPAANVQTAVGQLYSAGFKEVWIRE